MPRRRDSDGALAAKRELGRKIRSLRLAAGLTQLQLAAELTRITGTSWSPKTVATWEHTHRARPVAPGAHLYEALAQALRCSPETLYEIAISTGARVTNPLELATKRLERKLGAIRLQELSTLPRQQLHDAADRLISEHKDAQESEVQRDREDG